MSVYEIAEIAVKPGAEAAFEAGVREAKPLFLRHAQAFNLERCIEEPTRYFLRVVWASVQAHMDFRAHEDFKTWRGLVTDCFASPPQVIHTESVL